MTHEYEFFIHGFQILADIDALGYLMTPVGEMAAFLMTASEKENTGFGMFLYKLLNDRQHLLRRIDLSLMGSKRCHTNPTFISTFRTKNFRQLADVTSKLFVEDALKRQVNGESQTLKDIQIILNGCWLLNEQFFVFLF